MSADAAPGTFAAGLKDGWFTELSTMWPGQGLSLEVSEVLFQGRSDFQDVAVFKTPSVYDTVLVLDGVIQCTKYDEFSYQEMIAHLPLCSLKHEPKRVLVIGGGDGGVVREVSRHPYVERIEMAEIDKMVPEMGKRFFPEMACGFDDPRTQLFITDGLKYVQDAEEGTYDAIIVDSSDPVGPAAVLFEKPFFENMHRALKPGGVICTQAESMWLHLDIIKELAKMCSSVFVGGSVQYAYTCIPTYPSGQIGFMICTKGDTEKDCSVVQRPPPVPPAGTPLKPLKYYSSVIHSASFALPKFAEDAIKESTS